MTLPGDATPPDGADSMSALPCGALADELLEQVAEAEGEDLTDHQRSCLHCRAALAEFRTLWEPVSLARAVAVDVPAGLTAGIRAAVRQRIRDVWFTFEATDGGAIRVAARIVAVIARDTARRVPGVRVVLGRSSESRIAALVEKATLGHRHPHSAVGVLGRTAAVDLAIAVTYGEPASVVARRIQREVVTALHESIGLTGVHVNVAVDDVLPRPTS